MMKMRKDIFIVLTAVCLLTAACGIDDAAIVDLVELGTPQPDNEFILEADGGDFEMKILSNGPYHIELFGSHSWLSLGAESGSGDSVLKLNAGMNEEFKRMAGLVLCSDIDSRRDTVYIKQKGMLEALLEMENTSIIIDGKGGMVSSSILTNIPFDYLSVRTVYGNESTGWIENVSIETPSGTSPSRVLEITAEPNPYESSVRTADLLLSFADGWGDSVSLLLNLVQKNAREQLGTVTPFFDIRYNYSGGSPIEDYIILEGVVVSNPEGGNSGENMQETTSSIDYEGSKKTVYIQSSDGRYGFAVVTRNVSDNVFKQFDRVQILLHGATVNSYSDPERFEITGITKNMVVSRISGERVEPKKKRFADLTDDDIYTYVSVQDVEFPVRKGSITPVNEGYSIGGKANRISKYPLLVRDRDGNSFYMFTNTVCIYRNDGTRLPYGSGSLSGVLVHERFSRFEWKNGADLLDIDIEPELGYIGRYQLRHQTKDDIWGGMNADFKDSFSELLTEYRFWNPDSEEGVLRPTYGENGWFTHTYQKRYTGTDEKNYTSGSYGQHLYPEVCFSYLGPMGIAGNSLFGTHTGNENGLGIILDPERDRYNPEMEEWVDVNSGGQKEWLAPSTSDENNGIRIANAGSMAGKSWCASDCYCAFSHRNWWDYDNNQGYAWMLAFSTAGISTDMLSLQISVMNTSQKWYSPRYWKVEWSEDDSMNPEDASRWKLIGEYTVPDVSVWSNTLYSSIVGYKAIDFRLPLEMLGKDKVFIRLIPVNDLCSSGADYADDIIGTDVNGDMHASAIEYVAVRYNK